AELMQLMPPLVDSDRARGIWVYELIPDVIGPWSRWESPDGPSFGVEAARSLGQALATVHQVLGLTALGQDPRLGWLSRTLPWVMSVHQPVPSLLGGLSAANHQALRLLQGQGGVGLQLDRLRKLWRPGCVIHGDMKFDNVLVRPAPAREGPAGVAL